MFVTTKYIWLTSFIDYIFLTQPTVYITYDLKCCSLDTTKDFFLNVTEHCCAI